MSGVEFFPNTFLKMLLSHEGFQSCVVVLAGTAVIL